MTGLTTDKTTVSVKRIGLDEVDLVINLFDQYRIFYNQESDIELAQRFLTERLQNNESVIFAAGNDINGKFVPTGFTQLYPKYSSVKAVKNWTLNDLYVAKEYRKQGLGKILIDTAINFAKENKANFVQLSTANDNYNAQHLYESIGFTKQGTDNNFILYRINIDQ
jgi:ribosomal protein S18 acetylase RimI-like enzyme